MKKIISIVAIVATLSMAGTQQVLAQKFAYVNSEELISLMPEYATASKELETYVKEFDQTMEKMKKEFQVKYDEYIKTEKTLTENMKDIKQTELKTLDEKLQSFQQTAQEKIQAKQKALIEPITVKAEKAIKEVAAANGISYVFDMVSTGIIVAPPGDDMLPLLKTKLNLKVAASAPAAGGNAGGTPKPASKKTN